MTHHSDLSGRPLGLNRKLRACCKTSNLVRGCGAMMGFVGSATEQRRCVMGTGEAAPGQVEPLGEDRGDNVAALFGRAFQDDPVFVHACPDPIDRARWLPWLFRWSTWKGFCFGQILGTGEPLDGVVALIG